MPYDTLFRTLRPETAMEPVPDIYRPSAPFPEIVPPASDGTTPSNSTPRPPLLIAEILVRPIAEELAMAHMKNTVLSSASETFVSKHPNRGVAIHNMLANSERGYICPRTRVWPQFKKGMDENMQSIWKGSVTAAGALGDVQSIVQGAVDRAAVARKRRMA